MTSLADNHVRSGIKEIKGTEHYELGEGAETYEVVIRVPKFATKQARYIIEELLQGWVTEFCKKNVDYEDESGNLADELGAAGQWGDLYRKIRKLKRPMWTERGKGPKMQFEQVDEIIRDMIGHGFLAIYYHYQENGDEA